MVVPAATPVTVPLKEPIVPTPVLPLTHVPPGVTSVTFAVKPIQTEVAPPIAAADWFTVSTVVWRQPVPSE